MATPTRRPAPGQPSSPRSPTLSCADMILPESSLRSFSPDPYMERPPSPPNMHYDRNAPSPSAISLPPSSESSHSTLRTVEEYDPSSRQKNGAPSGHDTIASSPTIADGMTGHTANGWNTKENHRLSTASSSIHSEDLENMRWPAFDGPGAFDDSGVVIEGDGGKNRFPGITGGEDDMENDPWLEEQTEDDNEAYSSAALSRRAEIILANAKKRLNVMEGNLRGARQSLVVSPTLSTTRSESALSHQLAAARDRDRRLYAGQGPIPPRTKAYYSSPLSRSSPGHARGMSETAVPVPFISTYTSRANKRASSAMGVSSGPWAPENYGQGRFPIRESRSLETVGDTRNGWTAPDERDSSLHSYESKGSRSPPITLETLPEDEDSAPYLRPSSTTGDLRAQMQDLRGRISSLKEKAKEDNMRRRSLQTLRTSSPFTNAETWYAATETYKSGGSPVTADAGVGIKTELPVRKTLYKSDTSDETVRKVAPLENHPKSTGTHENVEHRFPSQERAEEYSGVHHQNGQDDQYADYPEYDDDDSVFNVDDFVSVDGDDFEQGGDSVYEDAVYDFPVAERHEDRVDAFDYENFFLHSAMGTYSSARRGSGSSSGSGGSVASVETTRPTTAVFEGNVLDDSAKRMSMHQRNASVDSVSTVATFATAAEEQSDDEDENEHMDHFSEQLLATQTQVPQPRHHAPTNVLNLATVRSDSVLNLRATTSSPAQASLASRGSSPGSDLASGLQTSKIYSILLEARTPLEEPRLALNEEEKQLIYGLAASFQQVCSNLQSTAGDQYERKEWRRRLDEARRVLNGEEYEEGPF